MSTHPCPATGCKRQVPREQLACRPHWYRLPSGLRRRISRAWRDRDMEAHSDALIEAMAWYSENDR